MFCARNIRILLILLLGLAAIPLFAEQSTAGYQLGAGDKVKITVYGHTDLSGTFELDAQGIISLPLIQSVNTQGLTQTELEMLVTNRLRPDYLVNPRVSVEILSYRPFYIVGEVRSPGDYPYQSNLSVLKAVALAGGYTVRANQKKIYITRSDDAEKVKRLAMLNTLVMPGDIITVAERFF